jgi:endonuclease/exonuclease/phosphatase family metal-dependent hydrolase
MSLSLVSLNIEQSKHLERVILFLQERQADVVCLQELMEYDIPLFEKELGMRCFFAGMTKHPASGRPGVMGVGILSRLPVTSTSTEYYWGDPGVLHDFDFTNATTKHATENHMVLWCDVEKDGDMFKIGTTHFAWTPDGMPDEFQRRDLRALLLLVEKKEEMVLCGDFNMPRGGELFAQLAERYKDNIPAHYKTSMDLQLHRARESDPEGLSTKMVDGLFTTPAYITSDVELVSDVSDHCAVVATVERRK